ncbi:DUF2835 domain-containing protein [Vibrio sp. ZSDZ34]|uniref:DUF2835 domain-containing protein n=1 Tax=Vibrio gelatinilyticus TaxID=2893468 RepID=A0A9X2AYG3_9VIBR|nr:DUF2835 domain-containing protein [Vibrio gelatinilyticus]MCJ2376618.1 DUF2835 domain-containing protein [Vibrio gelatinilyticus]
MKQYRFTLNIPYHLYQTHYSGTVSTVVVHSDEGLRLQLPAAKFRPFLTQTGVKGRFMLITDHNNKFIRLESL